MSLKPLKILYVGTVQGMTNIGKYYLFPQRMVNGFTRLGHNVYLFNDREIARASTPLNSSRFGQKKMNANLIKTCDMFAPELIILGHCWKVTNETLAIIRRMLPEVKIVYRNVDALDCPKNCERIKTRFPVVDALFSTTAGDILKQFAGPNNFSAFLPNPTDSSIDTGMAHTIREPEIDLFYAAAPMKNEDHRAVFTRELLERTGPELKTLVIGAGLNDRSLFGHHFMDALAKSAMGLSLNKFADNYLYTSDRMSQYLGNGLLTFCEKKPRHTDLFTDGEVVEFETSEDLAEKVLYYKKNPDDRMKVAKKGYENSRAMLDCTRVAQYMLDLIFDNGHTHEYEWPAQKYVA